MLEDVTYVAYSVEETILAVNPGGKSDLTDVVCCKMLLCMVGFLRPPTTSG